MDWLGRAIHCHSKHSIVNTDWMSDILKLNQNIKVLSCYFLLDVLYESCLQSINAGICQMESGNAPDAKHGQSTEW